MTVLYSRLNYDENLEGRRDVGGNYDIFRAPRFRFRFNTISRVASSENYVTFKLSGGWGGWGGCQDSHTSELTVMLTN